MASTTDTNPYAGFYKSGFGTIIGRPMAYNSRCDPNQRVFQETLLRNNTIIRVTPGIYNFEKAKLQRAKEILDEHEKEIQKIKSSGGDIAQDLDAQNTKTQSKLIKEGIDMRYLTFKPAFPQFLQAFQFLINRAGTSLIGRSNAATMQKFSTNIMDSLLGVRGAEQSAKFRGFNLWVEKSTSISETVSNSFTNSVFEGLTGKISRASRELSTILGAEFGNIQGGDHRKIETAGNVAIDDASLVGRVIENAGNALTGSKVILPQIWEDSRFDRSYNVSFRFVSPYGDDRSVFLNVIIPFMFILSCALPTQDGPSGMKFPFLVQMDCPGYFSCPMGVINSLSFTKGGSDALFSRSGLPLVIEGTFSVMDLYSSLSLPLDDSQFVTNLGTSAFISNIVGASLYQTEDAALGDKLQNYVKGNILKITNPINNLEAKKLDLMRWVGIASDDNQSVINQALGKLGF